MLGNTWYLPHRVLDKPDIYRIWPHTALENSGIYCAAPHGVPELSVVINPTLPWGGLGQFSPSKGLGPGLDWVAPKNPRDRVEGTGDWADWTGLDWVTRLET